MRKTVGLLAGVGLGILFAMTCQVRPPDPHEGLSAARVESPAPAAAARQPTPDSAPAAETETPDALFTRTVRPILADRCAPCHNPGGSMYARLPFDDPKTVADHRGGIVKRIKGDQRATLEAWLARMPATQPSH